MIQKKGVLVGIEGIDAAGKRTQTSLLTEWLRAKGLTVATISFPDYSTTIGNEIHDFLHGKKTYPAEVRHMLFAANRWEDKAKVEALLTSSDVSIVNRYTESNLAYGIANGLNLDWLSNLEVGLPKTDAVLVLDALPSVLYNRRASTKDRYERDAKIQERAREAYKELALRFGWKLIDASGSIQDTHRSVTAAVIGLIQSGDAAKVKGKAAQ
ncbi:MAG: dTMP kinase [Nitrososphaerales archaeon]|nr:dTMP kinase [Nitrososphaerales archaeon]